MKNELRIGNLVFDALGNAVKCDLTMIGNIELMKLKPIPLTEEWLLKFGFEVGWIISHEEEYFNMFQKGDEYFYSADQHHHTSNEIKYVHQLQNLYFALTGKELECQTT